MNYQSLSVPAIGANSHDPNQGIFKAKPLRSDVVRAMIRIHDRISDQVNLMSGVLTDAACRDCLRCIYRYFNDRLKEITECILQGYIFPWLRPSLRDGDPVITNANRPFRVGIYPVAANPIHWGHLAGGLSAMEQLRLDKVIYIIAGWDPRKPDLVSQEMRHPIAKNLVEMFSPLFAYSPLAWGNTLEGEINLFRFLELNRDQSMEVFYIAGTDHFHRINPRTGQPDTIWKLEDRMRAQRSALRQRNHSVSIAFLERELPKKRIESFLPIHVLPCLPFSTSSTSIRSALTEQSRCERLSYLPYDAFIHINTHRLYETAWPVSCCEDAHTRVCPIGEPWVPRRMM